MTDANSDWFKALVAIDISPMIPGGRLREVLARSRVLWTNE